MNIPSQDFFSFLAHYSLSDYCGVFVNNGISNEESFRKADMKTLENLVSEEDRLKVHDAKYLLEPGTAYEAYCQEQDRKKKEEEQKAKEFEQAPLRKRPEEDEKEYVLRLLRENGYEKLISAFEEQDVLDREIIPTLSVEEFNLLGVSIGERRRIIEFFSTINELNNPKQKTKEFPETQSEAGTRRSVSCEKEPEKKSPWGWIILVLVLLPGILWGYGYMKGSNNLKNGINLVTYYSTVNSMNPISASGYRTYFEMNTDIRDRMK